MNSLHYLFIIVILCRNNFLTQADDETTFRLTDKMRVCSNRLTHFIESLCRNMYKIVKRDTSAIIDKLIPEDLHEHMKRERLKRQRRVRRQVASECCDQPCTLSNMLLYCSVDSDLLKEHPEIFY